MSLYAFLCALFTPLMITIMVFAMRDAKKPYFDFISAVDEHEMAIELLTLEYCEKHGW